MDNIAVIDLDSIVYSAFHPNKILDELGLPKRSEDGRKFLYQEKTEEEIKDSCDQIMMDLLNNSEATAYIAYIKGSYTIQNRRSLNPEYKANRAVEPPKFWNFTANYLINKWGAIRVDNIEVDDAVNITRLNIKDSFISAIDGDLLGLEGRHWNWRNNEWVVKTKEEADYKFWKDMIVGQSVDNVKGIRGVGIKGANIILSSQEDYAPTVLRAYINVLGEEFGIDEFYRNFKSLKILDKYDGFIIPEPIRVNKQIVYRELE